jgi:hypothetical protein
MRILLTLVIATLLTGGGGYALCAAAGWDAHPASMLAAGAVALLAAGAALLPLRLTRGGDQAARAQAGLVGTLVHMLGCLAGAAVMLVVIKGLPGAAYWMLAFYWVTLIALVTGLAREVRVAPAASAGAAGGAAQKH